MRVTGLWTYPVKSLGGVAQERAAVTPIGLAGDRRWALLDPAGNRVSARECHAMLGITAAPAAYGVDLTGPDGQTFRLAEPKPGAPTTRARISRVDRLALAAEEAHAWISRQLGRDLRFAFLADTTIRAIGEAYGGRPGEAMSLADAGPLLLVSEASVTRLRDWVAEGQGEQWVDHDEAVRRFRPNIVVDGDQPFAEDGWERVRIGAATYRRGELCDRCVLTTIDLQALTTTKEPIRTLARHRRWEGSTWFGVRLIPELRGETVVTVGDPVVPE